MCLICRSYHYYISNWILSHMVLFSVQESLWLNKQYAMSLFQIQTLGRSNLWVLIQNFPKCITLFSELYFPKKSLLKCIPYDTTTVNQRKKMLNGYLQMDECKIKSKCMFFKVLLLLSLLGWLYSRDSNSENTSVSWLLHLRARTCLKRYLCLQES